MIITLNYTVVDAFTTQTFKGNPAAVIILDAGSSLSDTTLQHIASEFNLSETAFITPMDVEKGRFRLRWFTPKLEAALCGHATLASAFVLFFRDTLMPKTIELIEFETVFSGVLTARVQSDGRIELEFPIGEATAVEDSVEQKVKIAVQRAFPADTQPLVKFVGTGHGSSYSHYMLVEVNSEHDLETVSINPEPFREVYPPHRIIILTQLGRHSNEAFRSRVFAPAGGIPEDPVTGSAHSMLGPYWAKQLQADDNTVVEMVGKQVSVRSGEIGISVDHSRRRCKLRGSAILVAKGEIYLPG